MSDENMREGERSNDRGHWSDSGEDDGHVWGWQNNTAKDPWAWVHTGKGIVDEWLPRNEKEDLKLSYPPVGHEEARVWLHNELGRFPDSWGSSVPLLGTINNQLRDGILVRQEVMFGYLRWDARPDEIDEFSRGLTGKEWCDEQWRRTCPGCDMFPTFSGQEVIQRLRETFSELQSVHRDYVLSLATATERGCAMMKLSQTGNLELRHSLWKAAQEEYARMVSLQAHRAQLEELAQVLLKLAAAAILYAV
ncbi:hypothetical protein K435DRAFT_876399 [Dendrothele bispora CBS 962.96]|uniref:Uncharacterized protein n=1 Tax=Dendrothele bispora (strain CBS 962.96) TaxID=1314807 RepID=A0A4S8KS77_DENBC|nr:hypothetical protein K435DRAFT_876399 [Dendrothele bispora CBS 962.96]